MKKTLEKQSIFNLLGIIFLLAASVSAQDYFAVKVDKQIKSVRQTENLTDKNKIYAFAMEIGLMVKTSNVKLSIRSTVF